MKTISKLSDKCEKCKHVDSCDEKRAMLCMVKTHIEENPAIGAQISQPNRQPLTQPIIRDTSLAAERAEQIEEHIRKQLYGDCYFRRSLKGADTP